MGLDSVDLTHWSRDTSSPVKQTPYQLQDTTSSRRKSTSQMLTGGDEDDEEDCCCCPVDPVLCWFRFFHTISGLIGVATLGANIFVLVTVDSKSLNYKDIIMRSYAVIFCIIIILAGATKLLVLNTSTQLLVILVVTLFFKVLKHYKSQKSTGDTL